MSGYAWNSAQIIQHIFDVSQGYPFDLIPFVMFQASWDTSLEYPQHIILKTFKFHFI